ncbi:hypothetical protein BGZ92_005432 [Podila epicladia]|nr:hypothetical protein BGZ92_005432 [Podila epicladia]
MATQIPSSLFQADPNQCKISLHNATVSPAITLSVLPSSGFAVRSHTAARIEFVQDQEGHPTAATHATTEALSSSPPASELPDLHPIAHALLLKVHTGEGFRLSFDLEGHVLDLMSSLSETQTQAQTLTQTAETTATATETTTTTTTSEVPKATVENESEGSKDSQDNQPTTDVSLSNSNASVDDTTSYAGITYTAPPVVYFAEACSEQDMRDLCKEQEFQRQLAERAVSIVRPKLHSLKQDTVTKKDRQTFSWDWSYSLKDHVEEDLSGHKGVFAFLVRDPSTGTIQILSQFSFWILNNVYTNSSGMRFSQASGSNSRHWRRASTPEKSSVVSRHSSFRMAPASHSSLPSLPDAAGHTGGIYAETQGGPSSSSSSTLAFPPDSEDGPLFRATVVECENHIRDMKAATKRIIKAAQTALETRKSWVAAEEVFIKELESFKPAEPLLNNYLRPMTQCLAERSETLGLQMKNLLVEPLSRFYGNDLKAAEAHRKAFDDESKEYYTFLSRYMAMKQDNNRKKSEADAKYEKKRRHFEVKRFEYWGFLLEMRVGGSKSDEILHHLTNYSEKHCRGIMDMALHAEDLKPGLDAIAADLLESHKRAANLRKERLERKRELFESYDDGSPNPLPRGNSSANVSGSTPAPSQGSDGDVFDTALQRLESNGDQSETGASGSSPSSSAVFAASQINNSIPKFSGIRDLEHQDIDAGSALGRRKEGFLFATSRPSMHNNSTVLEKPSINWHKYWCVVSEGHLHEYSHWKKGATMLHNEPINLKISTVRSCRNQDRRFCFEVITPKFRRVYQATSTEDMNSWISVISNAIQSILNGTSSCQSLTTYASKPGAISGSDASGLSGVGRSSMDQVMNTLPISTYDRRQGSGSNELSPKGELRNSDHLGTRLLQLMREAHPSNSFCAECGAKNPDWCAINLGILICIECSGIHRSLGTHISKVRSFTLDTTSYTRDLFDFIRAVGNDVSKHIWEANQVQSAAALAAIVGDQLSTDKVVFRKPVVNDTREYKVSYIQKKYVERAFVDRQQYQDSTSETDLILLTTKALFHETVANNIPGVIAAFAAGANLNAIREIEPEVENESTIFGENDRPLSGTGHIAAGSDETTESSILSESQLQANLEGMSVASETSSRFSRSTIASSVLNTPGVSNQGQGLQDIRPPSQAEMSDPSFMVMQTSPLLLALRHGVLFSLDDQYEVYPLAEFMIQNGAASNLSVEVRFVENEELNAVADGRIQASGTIPEDEDSTVSSSALGNAGLEAAASWESTQVDPEDIKDLRQRSNRRSLGQVVNMREGGGSAMEYLRAKSAARGEAMPGSPPSTQSPANGEVATDSGSPSPVPQSTSTTNQQTLSPRFQPQNPTLNVSGSPPAPNSLLSSPTGSGSHPNTSRYQPTSIHQDISTLFQKRRESDGGLGPALFASGKATAEHQNNTQEKDTLQNPVSLASSPSQPSKRLACAVIVRP